MVDRRPPTNSSTACRARTGRGCETVGHGRRDRRRSRRRGARRTERLGRLSAGRDGRRSDSVDDSQPLDGGGRSTTTIPRPRARRASDAGRARVADARARRDRVDRGDRIAPQRRTAWLFGLGALVVAAAIAAALFGLPARTWFSQDDELAKLQPRAERGQRGQQRPRRRGAAPADRRGHPRGHPPGARQHRARRAPRVAAGPAAAATQHPERVAVLAAATDPRPAHRGAAGGHHDDHGGTDHHGRSPTATTAAAAATTVAAPAGHHDDGRRARSPPPSRRPPP